MSKSGLCLLMTLILPALFSCAAYDLGEEEFFEITINDATQWDGGISDLVESKCANCHTADRDQFVPANTPSSFDTINDEAFFTGQAATIIDRICSVYEPMPPDFATPLTLTEREAIETFLSANCP